MFNGEMRKPLIQSLIVVFAVIVLVGFVAGSDADTILGGLFSIIKGLFYSILFLIGLAIAIIVSIAILFGIYLAVIAIHSQNDSQGIFLKIKERIGSGYCAITSRFCPQKGSGQKNKSKGEVSEHKVPNREITVPTQKIKDLTSQIADKNEQIEYLKVELKQSIKKIEDLENDLETARLALEPSKTEDHSAEEGIFDTGHRLFNYFENEGEKQAVARIIHQAIKEDMTYNQVDEFLSQSLPKKLVTKVMEHPSLKKDYIREYRKLTSK